MLSLIRGRASRKVRVKMYREREKKKKNITSGADLAENSSRSHIIDNGTVKNIHQIVIQSERVCWFFSPIIM